ncbi:MAG: tRNA (cytidine(34)-2'-O)-methyltransferase [Alphaproteobacteria bacterium]|nr:tRNA (cytidine(34)-2'-O)-methyltransferase [Alphaproteobacteria bacterium]
MRIALYQPDIAQNTGTIIRMAVCFGLPVDIIEPCGFVWDSKELKRAGMDYLEKADVSRHMSWETFLQKNPNKRIVLLTTKSSEPYNQFKFDRDDILLFGRESAGVPDEVHNYVQGRIRIPMKKEERSLNLAVSCAIATAEALRQTTFFEGLE